MDTPYKTARSIFFNYSSGEGHTFPLEEGKKIRAALHNVVKRNQHIKKQFKTKVEKGAMVIWRKI
jgi:hypothetical protein